jgi:predicted ATPase
MTKEWILTGAPGAGKTVLLRQLEVDGVDVIEEAATDVIALVQGRGVAEPWRLDDFLVSIAWLQVRRASRPAVGPVRVADRSLACTVALAEYLGRAVPDELSVAVADALAAGVWQRQVLFVESLGFITPTEARRISLADARRFEAVHLDVYQRLGFDLVRIPPLPVSERVALVRSFIDS